MMLCWHAEKGLYATSCITRVSHLGLFGAADAYFGLAENVCMLASLNAGVSVCGRGVDRIYFFSCFVCKQRNVSYNP